MQSAAVALFVERAQATEPDFSLTEQNAEAVMSICVGLEGIPLAIELAAARVRMMSPKEIQERLGERLKLLGKGPRDLPDRQQTLRSAIDWSYNLLSEGEQKLFARLGVFVGGFTLSAAEAVCNSRSDLPFDTLAGIEGLLDKSLLKRTDMASEEPRFGMLEMLREYSAARLAQVGEVGRIERMHAEFYLALLRSAEPDWGGVHEAVWLARLDRDLDNIRAALRWTEASGEAEIGLRMALGVWWLWFARGRIIEGGIGWIAFWRSIAGWFLSRLSCGVGCCWGPPKWHGHRTILQVPTATWERPWISSRP